MSIIRGPYEETADLNSFGENTKAPMGQPHLGHWEYSLTAEKIDKKELVLAKKIWVPGNYQETGTVETSDKDLKKYLQIMKKNGQSIPKSIIDLIPAYNARHKLGSNALTDALGWGQINRFQFEKPVDAVRGVITALDTTDGPKALKELLDSGQLQKWTQSPNPVSIELQARLLHKAFLLPENENLVARLCKSLSEKALMFVFSSSDKSPNKDLAPIAIACERIWPKVITAIAKKLSLEQLVQCERSVQVAGQSTQNLIAGCDKLSSRLEYAIKQSSSKRDLKKLNAKITEYQANLQRQST